MKMQHIVAVAVLAGTASVGFAQQSMKPGLWEITQKMQSSSGQMEQGMAQMQQQMASMTPEQRAQVEQMMAQRGVKMGTAGGGGMSIKMCMTREMAERNEMPSQDRGECKKTVQRSGNTVKVAFTCTNPPSNGEGQYTFISPDAYSMKMVVHTTAQGRPETMNMDGTGKWLGADCGDIKPMRPPAK
jgi:hypothetical protein